MGFIFSKQEPGITPHDRAVLDLKTQRDRLHNYTKKTAIIIEKDTDTIKKFIKENKREKALLVLKRKKYQENLLDKNQKLLDNIQEMVDSIQFAQMELKVFKALKEGSQSLKEIHQQINLGELEDIMLDTEEGIQKQKEIDALLSGNLTEENESEILAELEELQKEIAKVDNNQTDDINIKLPDAPTDKIENDLEKLPDVPTNVLEVEKKEAELIEA